MSLLLDLPLSVAIPVILAGLLAVLSFLDLRSKERNR